MTWGHLLQLVGRACAEQGSERHVLVVLQNASYHVKELVDADPPGADGLLGFVVWRDDPALSTRTDETLLLCVRPDRVDRLEVKKAGDDAERGIGFAR